MMQRLATVALGLSLLAASLAHAQDRPIGFQTPSKNIACQFFTDSGQRSDQGVLRCDIMNLETRPRRPADCELEWGNAFEMTAKGAASRICAGRWVLATSSALDSALGAPLADSTQLSLCSATSAPRNELTSILRFRELPMPWKR